MSEREWAGNKRRQEQITKQIMKRYRDDHPIDMAGACETILSNLVNDTATTYESAIAGIDAIAGDMKETFKCDGKGCHDVLEAMTTDFVQATVYRERQNWTAKIQGSEWQHFCPECQQGTLL